MLTIILALSAILRFPLITTFPPSMVQDEVGLGYSAISIAQTGMDEWGNKYPIVFKSFGDYKPPAFFYATALLYKVIGWNFALPRLTSAIAGLFVVLFGSFWIRKQFNSDSLSLFGGLLLAISPWTVHISRMALESNLGLAFFMGGLMFLSYAKESKYKLGLSAIFFALSTYSYHGYRFTVVIFLLALMTTTILVNIKTIKKALPDFKTYLFILLLSSLFSLPGFLSNGATNRLEQTLLVSSQRSSLEYEHRQNNCYVTFDKLYPSLNKICNIGYNKFTKPVSIIANSYLDHLSPGFIFFSGDLDAGRNPTQTGELFLVTLPLWMMGFIFAFKKYKEYLVILTGYFVALIPSAVAGEPHSIRMTVLIPFLIAILVIGYKSFNKVFKNNVYFKIMTFSLLFISLGFISLAYLIDTFATHEIDATYLSYAKKAAQLSNQYIEDGYTVYADYDLYPEPHIYYAYWNRIDPKITQQSLKDLVTESEGFERPTQFGESLLFKEGKARSLTCNKEYIKPTVFLTNDPYDIKPQMIITDNTGSYSEIFVYEMDALREVPQELLSFCNY